MVSPVLGKRTHSQCTDRFVGRVYPKRPEDFSSDQDQRTKKLWAALMDPSANLRITRPALATLWSDQRGASSTQLASDECKPLKFYRAIPIPVFKCDFYENTCIACPQENSCSAIAIALGIGVYLQDMETEKFETWLELSNDHATALAWNSSTKSLMVGTVKGSLQMICRDGDESVLKWRQRISWGGLKDPIHAIAPYGDFAFVGTQQGQIFQVDQKNGQLKKLSSPPVIEAPRTSVTGIAVSPNKKYVAFGTNSNVICVHEIETFKLLYTYTMGACVKGMAFEPSGKPLLAYGGGSLDSRIRIVDFLRGIEIANIPKTQQITTIIWEKNRILATLGFGYNPEVILIPIDSVTRKVGQWAKLKMEVGPMDSPMSSWSRGFSSFSLDIHGKTRLVGPAMIRTADGGNESILYMVDFPKKRMPGLTSLREGPSHHTIR